MAETLPAWLVSEATGQLGLTEFSLAGIEAGPLLSRLWRLCRG